MWELGAHSALVAEAERRTVTSRLFMQPYPTDKDLEEIVVELVSAGNTEGADGLTGI